MATASRTRNHIMAGQQHIHDIVLHMQCHFLSVLIRIHVIHPNTTVSQLQLGGLGVDLQKFVIVVVKCEHVIFVRRQSRTLRVQQQPSVG